MNKYRSHKLAGVAMRARPKHLGSQKGFSKIDVSLSMIIGLVVMLGSVYAIHRILHADKVNKQISEVTSVFGKLKRQYQMQSNTMGVSVNNLAPLGLWPNEQMTKTGENWTIHGVVKGSTEHIFSNSAQIDSIPVHQGFIYNLHNMPQDMCAEVIKGLEKNIFAIYVTPSKDIKLGEATPTGEVVKANEDVSVKPDELEKACRTNSGNMVTISLVNRLTN